MAYVIFCSRCGAKRNIKRRNHNCAYVCMICRSTTPGFTPYKLPGVPTRCDICRREFMAQDGVNVCNTCSFGLGE